MLNADYLLLLLAHEDFFTMAFKVKFSDVSHQLWMRFKISKMKHHIYLTNATNNKYIRKKLNILQKKILFLNRTSPYMKKNQKEILGWWRNI